MEKIKIVVFSLFCLTFFLPTHTAQVSYNDIVSQQAADLPYLNHSAFAQSFNQFPTRKEKIQHLLNNCTKIGANRYKLIINNIPTITPGSTTQGYFMIDIKTMDEFSWAFLDLFSEDYYDFVENYKVVDREPMLKLQFNNRMSEILIRLAKPQGVITLLKKTDTISGSTIMYLVNGIVSLCHAGTIRLQDTGSLPEAKDLYDKPILLKALYPYLWGKTFYERYGFKPRLTAAESESRTQAQQYLTQRRLTEILEDFKDNPEVTIALLEGFNDLNQYFPEHFTRLENATIRDSLTAPFARIKTLQGNQLDPKTGKPQQYYIQLLKTIYDNCLVNYTSTQNQEKRAHIIELQHRLLDGSIFEKNYN
jgi:hypothetical protein